MTSPHCVCLHSLSCLNQLIDFYEISYKCRSLECHTCNVLTTSNMAVLSGTYFRHLK
jgi:hypothetical protein